MSLEQGYDTDVNEGGSRLSTGEKQLISFARAVLSNPRLLILDEATSSIDTQKEKEIQNAITKNAGESYLLCGCSSTFYHC